MDDYRTLQEPTVVRRSDEWHVLRICRTSEGLLRFIT